MAGGDNIFIPFRGKLINIKHIYYTIYEEENRCFKLYSNGFTDRYLYEEENFFDLPTVSLLQTYGFLGPISLYISKFDFHGHGLINPNYIVRIEEYVEKGKNITEVDMLDGSSFSVFDSITKDLSCIKY